MNRPLKVLVVEDEIVLQRAYELVLTHAGCEVHTANNGMEGLQIIKKIAPDVLFLDVFMPVLDGIDFLKNINKSNYSKTWIAVYSNLSDAAVEEKVLSLGADDFILKSEMTPADLVAYVHDRAERLV